MEEESVLVAGSWVIEALAKSDLVDATLLYELCPRILGDTNTGTAAREAREAVALKCLQALYPSREYDVPDSQSCLDPSQSCQDVLHRIWRETDNLQKDASDELKSSVQTFVKHKKATSTKSTLELLKDAIQQGNHPVFKKISEQVFGDECGVDVPSSKYGHPMHPETTSVKIPRPSETLCQQVNTCNPASEINDQLRDFRISNTSSEQSKKEVEDDSKNSHKEANQTRGGEASEKIAAKTFKENEDLPRRSSDNGAAMNKAIFSGSQHVFNEEDSVTEIETEANTCIKCNKGGQLLSCCGSTCPLRFHKTCLGCSVSFDDRGDFYCPMCAYSRAAADFVKAKERASLARKELNLFMGGQSNDDQPKHNRNKSSEDVLDQQIPENRECI